jgi:hypothetical protein
MNPHLTLAPRRFPGPLAELGFSALVPTDWVGHDVAETEVGFTDPTRFTPLAVLTAPQAAIVLAVAARPAYDDGTVHDWAWYVLNHNQLAPRAVGRDRVAGVGAVVGEAVQPSDLGPMLVRFAFFEDGGRLLNITLTAPDLFADAVLEVWLAVLRSFTLETPRGSRFAVEAHPADMPAAETTDEPAAAREPRPAQATSFDNAPAWWHEALALEAQGRLEAAEAHIRASCPTIGFACATADMYLRRMGRLKAGGDAPGALDAFLRSSDFIWRYASMATSGGEGAALSIERDEFRAQLVSEYGSDPESEQAAP